jgi:hypothetical protein
MPRAATHADHEKSHNRGEEIYGLQRSVAAIGKDSEPPFDEVH